MQRTRRERSKTWLEFWDSADSVHFTGHPQFDNRVARDIASLIPFPQAIVLDYGCGRATAANVIAACCSRLILCEAVDNVTRTLAERYCNHPKITVLAANKLCSLPPRSIDLVITHSVVQYLSHSELEQLLAVVRVLLTERGILVISDVITPGTGVFDDAMTLLRLGFKEGFLTSAIFRLGRIFLSDYRTLRSVPGLSSYDEHEMLTILRSAGFFAGRHQTNVGHNQGRMTFIAHKAAHVSDQAPRGRNT